MKQPYSIWSRHLTGDRQQNFEDLVKNSTTVLERVRQLIDEEIEALYTDDESEGGFDSPNWAIQQAGRVMARAKLKRLRKLFDFIPER